MAEELYFPSVDQLPNGSEYQAENGVTYTWNTGYSSWMIGSSQQVNKDYVDSRDMLRLRLDGKNFMYGDFEIRDSAETGSELTAGLSQRGVLTLGLNKNINFTSGGGTISVAGTSFLKFSNTETNVETKLYWAKHLTKFSTYTGTNPSICLVDFNTTTKIAVSVALPKNDTAYFDIRKSGSQYGLFRVKADGTVQCRGVDAPKALVVLPGGDGLDDAFHVAKNRGVYAGKEFNEKLLNSANSSNPEPDRAVATKGYVDHKSARPGYGIVATSEAEAEINGFWRNGNNLYIRIS